VAQVGRISGPLLEANLERNGIDLAFRNDLDTVQVLYLDVNSGRIAINRDVAAADLDVTNTTIRTVNLIGDTAPIANYTFSTNDIDVSTGDIFLNASEAIVLSNLETPNFFASDNAISSKNNSNIELRPNGSGTLEIFNDLRVYGNLHATGNITLDGTITFGDALVQDTVTFDVDVDSDIVPTTTDTYRLGSALKRWDNLYSLQANGQLITAGAATISGIDLALRQEYTLYVATNGDDTNVGDHIQGPLASIQAAIAKIPPGTANFYTIYVFPGTYAEQLPLVLPANATIAGNDIRNTIVVPAVGYEDNDVFHMNGQTTVQNLTVKNFYYDSVNNTGYAFRFAPNGVITSRSPYIQNVSVITQGSTTSIDDPRGFVIGDAGRGAYIDGAELSSSSFDASMLFHSVTMITPGVDAVTMTNGVRVEWLNSFTYFANRGLYAVNGATGRTSQDGSTINRGAEVRSIGSANVYGNYGAVADGADTLMYLILHNFAYIGTGKDFSNDSTLTIQANEVVKLNSGKIYYQSHNKGKLRIGDAFFVDLERGTTSVDLSTLTTNSLSGLVINTGTDTTTITGSKLETGNIRVSGNLIQSLAGDLNVVGATNEINLLDNTNISADLDIVGNFSFDGTLSLAGNEVTDGLRFNIAFEQDFNPHQHLQFSLGTPSKQWLAAYLNRLEAGDFSIYDNVIETNVTNSDLELRANGTGLIYIPDSATFSNALDVSGVSDLNDVTIQGDFNLTGVLTQTGNINVSDNLAVSQNITIDASAQFEEILIDGNVITTTTSNTNLELRAADLTSVITIQEVTDLQQNLSTNDIFAQSDINVTLNLSTDNAFIGNIEFNDNYIQTTGLNQSLTLLSAQNVTVTSNNVTLNQALTVIGNTDTQSVSVTGLVDHAGNRNQTGDYNIAGEFTNGDILIEDNFITTTDLNSNLELRANGAGTILVPNNNVIITNDLSVDGVTDIKSVSIIGTLTHTGVRNQTGNYLQTGNLDITGTVSIDSLAQFTDISVSGNTLTTTLANNDLILNADGNGLVIVQSDLDVSNSLSARSITVVGDIVIDQDLDLENISIPPSIIDIGDNYISTKVSNADLELRANGTGSVIIDGNDIVIEQDLTVNSTTNLKNTVIGGTTLPSISVGSAQFSGSNYLSVAGDAGTAMGTGDFTWECWVYPTSSSDYQCFIDTRTSPLEGGDNTGFYFGTNFDTLAPIYYTDGLQLASTESMTLNAWNHVALTRNSGTVTLWVNGVSGGTQSNATDLTQQRVFIGGDGLGGALNLIGNISNLRIVKGTAVYTTPFTVPTTALTAISGTQLLLLEDTSANLLEDSSTNNFTVTNNGTVVWSALSPIIGSPGGTISSTLTHTGNRVQLGNYSQTGDLTIDGGITLTNTATLDDIEIDNNVLRSTSGNLVLTANGTGLVTFSSLLVEQNLTAGTLFAGNITIDDTLALEMLESSTDIQIFDNVITTTNSNSDLELRTNGTGDITLEALRFNGSRFSTTSSNITIGANDTVIVSATGALTVPTGTTAQRTNVPGDIRFNTTDSVFEARGQTNTITFDGVYSSDRRTSVLAHPTNNTLLFTVNQTSVGTISATGLTIHAVQTDDILLDTNRIATTVSNSNLELRSDGTGELVLGNLSIKDNFIKNASTPIVIASTGFGYTKLAGAVGVVFPTGTDAERPAPETPPQLGDARFNTDDEVLEVWDGSTYIAAAGTSSTISESEFNDLVLEYTLILG
jgi:hypothetical protein